MISKNYNIEGLKITPEAKELFSAVIADIGMDDILKEFLEFLEVENPKDDSEPITEEEIAKVKEIMGKELSDYNFDELKIKRKWGCIDVSTPSSYWACLMGREWLVNLEKNKYYLFSLS